MLAATNYRQGETDYTDPAAYYTVRRVIIIIVIIIIVIIIIIIILTFDMDSNVTNHHMLAATNYRQGETNYTDPAAYNTVRRVIIIIIIVVIIIIIIILTFDMDSNVTN
jgi:heme/copper-type cytochrome/quinol oxidase subunit 2